MLQVSDVRRDAVRGGILMAAAQLFPANDEAGVMRAAQLQSGLVQRTDTTNADRLIKQFGDVIRYNPAWKKWLVWDGRHWEVDEGEVQINEYVKIMVRGIYRDMLDTSDYKERLEIEKFAVSSESMRRINACISLASKRAEIRITSDGLDTNPMLFNVENGTLDFAAGTFREHSKDDYITKIARVYYDVNASCPVWDNFIREIMDYKPGLIKFLQTAAGLGITGVTKEQVMFILFGSGANGKSTFLNTVLNMLGDYAVSTQTETFIKQNADKISNDIARLRGTRFVTATETEQGKKLAEPLIKQITGNDKLTARFLFSEYFSFLPTFKIFMAANHKPVIKP
jgi:putative DNA primase/helicase